MPEDALPSLATGPWRRTASELAALIAQGALSSREVVQAHLDRIDAVNPAVNALTTRLDDQALAAADDRDRRRRAGELLGPLHGVPVTVKESIDVAGSPTTMGNPSRAGLIPPETGPEAEGLLRAGAVIIGRTNAPDFSLRIHTDNELHGPSRNPWDPSRSPGGSGGGEAIAVATGMSPLGLGGDTGGSLRVPSQWCGITTLKPTPGRVPSATSLEPREPTLSLALMTSFGPFARSVHDVRLAYRVLARPDPRDPWIVPLTPELPAYATPTAVAVVDAADADAPIRDAVRSVAAVLEDAGFELRGEPAPEFQGVADLWARLFLTDVAFMWGELEPVLGHDVRRWLTDALAARPPLAGRDELVEAYRERHALAEKWSVFQAQVPLIVAPAMTIPAPPVGFDLAGEAAITELFERGRYVFLANLIGLPAALVTVGVANGLPVGVQLVGPRFGEALCLAAAELVEQAFPPVTPIDPR